MNRAVISSIAIGVSDVGGIYLLQHFGLLITPNGLAAWASAGFVLWAAAFGFGLYRWGVRSFWSLLGLPLVLAPFAAIIVAAGI